MGATGVFQGRALLDRGPSARVVTSAGWVVGLVVTALVVGTPYLWPAYHSPSLHLILDTVDTCVALLVATLVYGRFVRTRRLQDLLLAEGLLLLAVAGLGMTLLLEMLSGYAAGTVDVWLPVALRTCGAAFVALAGFAGDRPVGEGWARRARWVPWVIIVAALVVFWSVRDRLPVALTEQTAESLQRPHLAGHPLLFAAYAVAAACFFVGSVAFTVQADRQRAGQPDALLQHVGAAFALAGFARVNYMLFPSLYSGWLYTGDVLRTGCYLVLFVGAAREIRQYWSAQAQAAVFEDRRRLARELHDGVVQELGYIRMEAHAIGDPGGAQERILASCDRALDEARAAVDALGGGPDEPLGVMLHRAAHQVAERYHASLEVELDDSVTADPEHRHALVRITREAVSNAIRHGKVSRVSVRLVRDESGRRQLLVQDEGDGFDIGTAQSATGYGLKSMAERARALHGSFDIESDPGRGTTVAVTW